MRDINGEFPTDSHPYTEDYDYLSDSDLEDGEEDAETPEDDDPEVSLGPQDSDSQVTLTTPLKRPPQPSLDASKVYNE